MLVGFWQLAQNEPAVDQCCGALVINEVACRPPQSVRLQLQSGLWQAIPGVYEVTPYVASSIASAYAKS